VGCQRGRGLDGQPARLLHADGLIATGLTGLAVGGQKHPARLPAVPPLPLTHVGGVEVVAGAPQAFSTNRDRRPTRSQGPLGGSQSRAQSGQPARVGEPLSGAVIAPQSPRSPPASLIAAINRRQFAGPHCAPPGGAHQPRRAARPPGRLNRASPADTGPSPRG
jgi:hypothetical protein